jgi:hypothetical protein
MELRTSLYVNASHLDGLYFSRILRKTLKFNEKAGNILLFLSKRENLVNVYEFAVNECVIKQVGICRGSDHEED